MIDDIDRKLLNLLQKNGNMSHAELSEQVNLSVSACHRRVQQLEKRGVIDRYVALVDRAKVGRGVHVFVEVSLTGQAQTLLEEFERAVARYPEILECHLISGDTDYMLKVAVADSRAYEQVHTHVLSRLPHVSRVKSIFSLREVKQTTEIAL